MVKWKCWGTVQSGKSQKKREKQKTQVDGSVEEDSEGRKRWDGITHSNYGDGWWWWIHDDDDDEKEDSQDSFHVELQVKESKLAKIWMKSMQSQLNFSFNFKPLTTTCSFLSHVFFINSSFQAWSADTRIFTYGPDFPSSPSLLSNLPFPHF